MPADASLPPAAPALVPGPSLLEMRGITKRFPGVLANDDVSLEVRSGEVHALLGENGAGKTTLVNILYGLQAPDEGEILIAGQPVRLTSPRDAARHGVGLVAQHFHLARRHTVAENIGLGLASTPFWRPVAKLEQDIAVLGARYKLSVDPRARVWQLSPGEQQRVEILKALIRGAKILILDEPTSVLTPQEAESLFAVLRAMREAGEAVIFISHKLTEVMAIADRVTVLRKGRVVGNLGVAEASPQRLATLMMGREVPALREKVSAPGAALLRLDNVRVRGDRGGLALRDISLTLHAGEILGVAGVAGNGQGELIDVLTGLRRSEGGRLELSGQDITGAGVRGLFEAGVAHIPEDRNHMGVAPAFTVTENLMLRHYRYRPFARGLLLDWPAATRFAEASIRDYEVATPSRHTPARLLSGGNVQKLILARELSGQPRLVVAAHPTYGLDVSATALTHNLLLAQRDRGAGVLLVSEDLDELLKLSDRVAVLFGGALMGIVDASDATPEALGLWMAGVAA